MGNQGQLKHNQLVCINWCPELHFSCDFLHIHVLYIFQLSPEPPSSMLLQSNYNELGCLCSMIFWQIILQKQQIEDRNWEYFKAKSIKKIICSLTVTLTDIFSDIFTVRMAGRKTGRKNCISQNATKKEKKKKRKEEMCFCCSLWGFSSFWYTPAGKGRLFSNCRY